MKGLLSIQSHRNIQFEKKIESRKKEEKEKKTDEPPNEKSLEIKVGKMISLTSVNLSQDEKREYYLVISLGHQKRRSHKMKISPGEIEVKWNILIKFIGVIVEVDEVLIQLIEFRRFHSDQILAELIISLAESNMGSEAVFSMQINTRNMLENHIFSSKSNLLNNSFLNLKNQNILKDMKIDLTVSFLVTEAFSFDESQAILNFIPELIQSIFGLIYSLEPILQLIKDFNGVLNWENKLTTSSVFIILFHVIYYDMYITLISGAILIHLIRNYLEQISQNQVGIQYIPFTQFAFSELSEKALDIKEKTRVGRKTSTTEDIFTVKEIISGIAGAFSAGRELENYSPGKNKLMTWLTIFFLLSFFLPIWYILLTILKYIGLLFLIYLFTYVPFFKYHPTLLKTFWTLVNYEKDLVFQNIKKLFVKEAECEMSTLDQTFNEIKKFLKISSSLQATFILPEQEHLYIYEPCTLVTEESLSSSGKLYLTHRSLLFKEDNNVGERNLDLKILYSDIHNILKENSWQAIEVIAFSENKKFRFQKFTKNSSNAYKDIYYLIEELLSASRIYQYSHEKKSIKFKITLVEVSKNNLKPGTYFLKVFLNGKIIKTLDPSINCHWNETIEITTSSFWTDILKISFISQKNKMILGSRIYELSYYELSENEVDHWISLDQNLLENREIIENSFEKDFERISKSVQLHLKISSTEIEGGLLKDNREILGKGFEKILKLDNHIGILSKSMGDLLLSHVEANDQLPFPENFLLPSDYLRLKSIGIIVNYNSDSIIYNEGQNPEALFIVLEGEVTITFKDHTLFKLSPGRIFGATQFADEEFHISNPSSAYTNSSSILLRIPESDLLFLLENSYEFSSRFFRMVGVWTADWLTALNRKVPLEIPELTMELTERGKLDKEIRKILNIPQIDELVISETQTIWKRTPTDAIGLIYIYSNQIVFSMELFGSSKLISLPFKDLKKISISNYQVDKFCLHAQTLKTSYEFQLLKVSQHEEQHILEAYDKSVKKANSTNNEFRVSFLDENDENHPSKYLSMEDWELILKGSQLSIYKPGDTILAEGIPNRGVFQVASGIVRIESQGKPRYRCKKGQLLGLSTFVRGAGVSRSTYISETETAVYCSKANFLNALFRTKPSIVGSYYHYISSNIAQTCSLSAQYASRAESKREAIISKFKQVTNVSDSHKVSFQDEPKKSLPSHPTTFKYRRLDAIKPEHFETIVKHCTTVKFLKGSEIVSLYSQNEDLFFLKKGKVFIYVPQLSLRKKKNQGAIEKVKRENSIVGFISFLTQDRHSSCSFIAAEDSELLKLPGPFTKLPWTNFDKIPITKVLYQIALLFASLFDKTYQTYLKTLSDREKLVKTLGTIYDPDQLKVFSCKRIGTITHFEGTLAIGNGTIFFSGKGLGSLQKEKIKIKRIIELQQKNHENDMDITILFRKKDHKSSDSVTFRVNPSDGVLESLQFATKTLLSRSSNITLWSMRDEEWDEIFPCNSICKEETFPENFEFLTQGIPIIDMFLLTKDKVTLKRIINGNDEIIRTLTPPVLIGSEILINFQTPLSLFSIFASEECTARRIFAKEWERVQASNPSSDIAKKICQEISVLISKIN